MAININSLEELKQIFKEQEETEQSHQKAKTEAENIKAERLKLDQRKQKHKEQQDAERLKILQDREQRARAKESQQTNQIKQDNKIYLFSILVTFGSLLASVLLFIIILLKY